MRPIPAIFLSHGMPVMAPEADRNHPYPAEHFLPLLGAAGAGTHPLGAATRLHDHFEYGVLSLAACRWD